MYPNVPFLFRTIRYSWNEDRHHTTPISGPSLVQSLGADPMAMDTEERVSRLQGQAQETKPTEKKSPSPSPEKGVFVMGTTGKELEEPPHLFHSLVAMNPTEFRRELGPLKILVALDEWALKTGLLDCAKTLSQIYPAHFLFFHVQEPHEDPQKILDWDFVLKKSGLAGAVETASPASPEDAIREKARKESCSLILTATHGRLGKERILKGSVAEELLKQADCPVLVHKPGTHWIELRRILLPFQDPAALRNALPVAVGLCRDFKADLWLFHVQSPTQSPSSFDEESLRPWLNPFPLKEPSSTYAEGQGSVPEAIAKFSNEKGIDLAVMTIHHKNLQSELLPSGITSQVLRGISCALWGIPVS